MKLLKEKLLGEGLIAHSLRNLGPSRISIGHSIEPNNTDPIFHMQFPMSLNHNIILKSKWNPCREQVWPSQSPLFCLFCRSRYEALCSDEVFCRPLSLKPMIEGRLPTDSKCTRILGWPSGYISFIFLDFFTRDDWFWWTYAAMSDAYQCVQVWDIFLSSNAILVWGTPFRRISRPWIRCVKIIGSFECTWKI